MPPESTPASTSIIAAAQAALLKLSPRQMAFVEAFARPSPINGQAFNASDAARAAGYKARRINSTAGRLLRKPKIKEAVAAIRAEVAERAGYTVERCMVELATGMEFALKTDNASAYVRAVELRGKLTGLLVDRVDMRATVGVFAINVIGLEPADSLPALAKEAYDAAR